MYLEHFELEKLPFALTPNTVFYCNLPEHQGAPNVILFGLKSGEGFIKIIGEVGSGKTLLCRKVLNSLGEEFVTAYIPNPDLTPSGLRRMLAKELGVSIDSHDDAAEVLDKLQRKLINLHQQDKTPVLLIDEAQTLSDESLEALRLLSNLETESHKLIHIVLFAQPELDDRLKKKDFRQLSQRIAFSYFLKSLTHDEMIEYIYYRLAKAGCTRRDLFNDNVWGLLYKYSKGVPRLINILCHKAMLSAYGRGKAYIQKRDVLAAIKDSTIENLTISKTTPHTNPYFIMISTFIIVLLAVIIVSESVGWLRW